MSVASNSILGGIAHLDRHANTNLTCDESFGWTLSFHTSKLILWCEYFVSQLLMQLYEYTHHPVLVAWKYFIPLQQLQLTVPNIFECLQAQPEENINCGCGIWFYTCQLHLLGSL